MLPDIWHLYKCQPWRVRETRPIMISLSNVPKNCSKNQFWDKKWLVIWVLTIETLWTLWVIWVSKQITNVQQRIKLVMEEKLLHRLMMCFISWVDSLWWLLSAFKCDFIAIFIMIWSFVPVIVCGSFWVGHTVPVTSIGSLCLGHFVWVTLFGSHLVLPYFT